VPKKKAVRKDVKLSDNVVVSLEREGIEYRVVKDGKVYGIAGGDFREVCFYVDDYELCLSREELDNFLRGD
jgi:hypothetical protein